jgi:outer membrane receptor protein involved in Fe transport
MTRPFTPPHLTRRVSRSLFATRSGFTRLSMLAVLAAMLSLPAALLAQAPAPTGATPSSATLSGTVTDDTGAVVANMALTLTDTVTRAARQATTDAQGAYVFAGVAPGRYTLTGGRDGFTPVLVENLVLGADERRALPLKLVVATLNDSVAVVANTGVPTRSIGATRTDTPLIETPQAITVITRDQIEAQAAQNIQEVVRYTAGVRAEMYGLDNRGDWFTMRGGSEGSTVIDGLRQPLSGWWGNVRNEPFAFDRVEVVRGPASVMFGQNGPGGVINLVTKLPQAQARQEISLQFGNYEHKQIAADFKPFTPEVGQAGKEPVR